MVFFTIYHLPVKSLFFTILPVNLKVGKSSTLLVTPKLVFKKSCDP